MVIFPMSLKQSRGFQGHSIFEVEYLKTVHFRDKVTKEH